jgi:2-iminobutanoate/2-iminopropanoate deaminase
VADEVRQSTDASSSATARQYPYASASVAGRMIFLAAVDSRDPQTGEVRGSTAEEQTELLFLTMKQTLESLGSSLDQVISVTTVLTDAHHQPGYAKVKRKYLPHAPPSKLICGPQLAHPRLMVQIEATAVLSS